MTHLANADQSRQDSFAMPVMAIDSHIDMAPAIGTRPIENKCFHGGGRLASICAYIRMHLDEPIRLPDLEKNSGISRRNLQYVFMREFSCTPMRWVRTERLAMAYRMLADAAPGTRITTVALSCGFDNLAMFSTYFKQQFGELPSQLLKRSREGRRVRMAGAANGDAESH